MSCLDVLVMQGAECNSDHQCCCLSQLCSYLFKQAIYRCSKIQFFNVAIEIEGIVSEEDLWKEEATLEKKWEAVNSKMAFLNLRAESVATWNK